MAAQRAATCMTGPLRVAVLLLAFVSLCCARPLPQVDPRVHRSVAGVGAAELFARTNPDDPMAYFYGVHYSTASCGLSRRSYMPRHNDVLVPLFCRCVNDPECPARSDIIRELGFSGDRRAVPALIQALNDPTFGCPAAAALGQLKDERAVEPLIARVRAGRAGPYTLYALSAIRTPRAIDCLCDVLANDKSQHMREHSAIALGWVKPGRHREALQRAWRGDPDMRVRIFSACTLELQQHDEGTFQFIVRQLKSRDLQARRAASECICFRLEMSSRTILLIIQTLRDDDEETAGYAWEELDKHLADETIFYSSEHKDFKGIADQYESLWNRVKANWKDK